MKTITKAVMALAAAGTIATATTPALAHDFDRGEDRGQFEQSWNHGGRYGDYDRYDRYRNDYRGDYYRGASWRGRDGRTYCRRNDGTTGLLIGGAAGALIGREVAGYRGDRTLGAILGAAGGALLGREVDRGGSRCR